ncbi:DNA polymerase IV, partial [Calditrichota bacterium]
MSWHHDLRARKPPLSSAMLENDHPVRRLSDGTSDSSTQVDSGFRRNDNDRIFLHIDMDAFFASVEIRDNPTLKGRPVAVGGGYGDGKRGIITAASYEARKYGLKAGMTALEAHRKCPQAVFLPINGRKYTYVSALIMKALETISPDVRPLSIDEASLEITGLMHSYREPLEVGEAIRQLVRKRFNLPCTVGIGPNRLVAKMASGLGKPDGLFHIPSGAAASVFAPLGVQKMVGIGEKTREKLYALGIQTLGQLA